MPTNTTRLPDIARAPDVAWPTAQASLAMDPPEIRMGRLLATLMVCLDRYRQLTQHLQWIEDKLRTSLRDWLATQEDPATARQWLLSQPFIPLGFQIPEACRADLTDPTPAAAGSTLSGQSVEQEILTRDLELRIISTAKLVTIVGLLCRIWESTDDDGKTSLVYVPLLRMADIAADSTVAYKLKPAYAIDSRMVLPSGPPPICKGHSTGRWSCSGCSLCSIPPPSRHT
jgi:hypothetical protein